MPTNKITFQAYKYTGAVLCYIINHKYNKKLFTSNQYIV